VINELVSADILAPNSTDSDYPGNQVAEGGDIDGNGGDGHILLIWE